MTCTAFGPQYVVDAQEPTRCSACTADDRRTAVVTVVALSMLFVGVLALYVLMVARMPDSMRKSVTTISILVAHVQVHTHRPQPSR
jgi:uncharacterized membrane protein